MPSRRNTNNSVSTLEEQTLLIRIMADKGSASSSPSLEKGGDKRQKSSKRKGKSSEASAPATLGGGDNIVTTSAPITVTSGNNVTTAPVTLTTTVHAPGVQAYSVQGQGQNGAPTPGTSYGGSQAQGFPPGTGYAAGSFGQPGGFFQQPFYYPGSIPQMPGFFPQSQLAVGFPQPFPQMMDQEPSEGDWEAQSVQGGDKRPIHDISDDEDEDEDVVVIAPRENTGETVDFDSLKPGKMADYLKQTHKHKTEGDKVGEELNPTLAKIISEFFDEVKVNAVNNEIESLAKEFPRPKNLEKLVVPKLEQELFGAVDQHIRNADVAVQTVQKALVGAAGALAPLAALMAQRGNSDVELDTLSPNIMKAINMLVLSLTALSARRREQLKPTMQATYAKAMTKQEGSPEWLYGGNLSEITRKCEQSKRLAEKVMKKKQGQQQQSHNQQPKGNPRNQNKRFRHPNPNQQQQFYGQRTYGYGLQNLPYQVAYQQTPQQYQAWRPRGQNQQAQGQQHQMQQQQDFRPRGARK